MGYIFAVLPVAVFALLLRSLGTAPLEFRIMRTSVVWALLLVALTEGLSLFRALSVNLLACGWAVVLITLVVLGLRMQTDRGQSSSPDWRRFPLLLATLMVVAVPTLIIAIVTLPNTVDALVYHIARVDHWIQNHSVEYYPAGTDNYLFNSRVNEYQPLSEYIILNFQLLSGSDSFSNLLQWFSMAGSLFGVFAISKEIGASNNGSALAVVFAATLPIGILESSSTQTDYVVTFWLICFVALGLRWRAAASVTDLLLAAAALGLAVLAKGSSLIFAAPFAIWISVPLLVWVAARPMYNLPMIAAGACLVILPNLPHALKNVAAYGTPLGGPSSAITVNDAFSIAVSAENIIRNAAVQFATPFKDVNDREVEFLKRISSTAGLDLDDPHSSFLDYKFTLSTSVNNEDIGVNIIHLIGLLIVLCYVTVHRKQLPTNVIMYCLCLISCVILFNSLIKWQPWINRLLLPGFVLSAPVFGVAAGRCTSDILRASFGVVLLAGALPFVLVNDSKRLLQLPKGRPPIWRIARDATMFVNNPAQRAEFKAVGRFLGKCNLSERRTCADWWRL